MKPVYSNVSLQAGTLTAGISKIQVSPREWLTADPVIDFETGIVTTALSFAAGKDFIELEFTPGSYEFDEKPMSGKSGQFLQVVAIGTINNYGPAVKQVLDTIRYSELVVLLTDRLKNKRIIGDTEVGMVLKLTHKIKNGTAAEESMGVELMIETEDAPPFYAV